MFKLGIITDEVSQDLEHVLDVMEDLGLEYAELQSLWDKFVGKLSDEEVTKVKRMITDRGMKVSCLSPRLFFGVPVRAGADDKSPWGSYSEHMEDLKHCIGIAKELGTNLVRTFSFNCEILREPPLTGDWWSMLIDKFKEPLKIAKREGITLAVETCFINNVVDCHLARKFIDDLASENMKVLWDVANCLYFGEKPYPDGYELIKEDIVHIHLKDGVVNLPQLAFHFCAPGKGQVKNYPDILKRLQKDGYEGVLSFECEYIPEGGTKEDAARECVAAFREMENSL